MPIKEDEEIGNNEEVLEDVETDEEDTDENVDVEDEDSSDNDEQSQVGRF